MAFMTKAIIDLDYLFTMYLVGTIIEFFIASGSVYEVYV